jgi:hypothetical protein
LGYKGAEHVGGGLLATCQVTITSCIQGWAYGGTQDWSSIKFKSFLHCIVQNNQSIEASPSIPAEMELARSNLNPASPDPNKNYLIPNLKFKFKFKSREPLKESLGS